MEALILVDLQNDFLPGGALAVPRGDEVIPLANALQPYFPLVVATQDWHPADHLSFASQHPGSMAGDVAEVNALQQVLWPDHCVQGTPGAALAANLHTDSIAHVIRKGTDRQVDSYSGFFDNDRRRATGLHEYLQARHVTDVYILGLATDYCVRATALDAARLGYRVQLIEDACRGVNLRSHDAADALREMERAGVQRVPSSRWLSPAERLARREQELQVLAQGRFLRLVKAERWEYAERINTSGVVIIVPVTTENELLLIEQHRPPLGRRCLEFPAGLVGDRPELNQEPPLDAVRRELEEETGYAADNIRLLGHASPTAGLTSELVSVYLATGLRRVSAGGGAEGEQILVHRVPWSEAGAWLARRASEGLEVAMSVYGGIWWAAYALQHPSGPGQH